MPAVYSRVCRNLQSKAFIPFLINQFNLRLVLSGNFELHFRRRSYFGVAGFIARKKLIGPEHYGNPSNGVNVPPVPAQIRWILPYAVMLSSSVNCLKSLSTFTSHDEVTINDDFVNQIISGVEDNHLSDTEVCTFVDKLCRYGSVSEIAKLLSALQYRNIYLSVGAYDLLLATTSREHDVELSLVIFRGMLLSSSSLSSGAYFNLARAFSRTNECTPLLTFVAEISEWMLMRSCIRLFNRMIFAFGEVGQAQKALVIFDHMRSLKFLPDLCTYNTVIEILGHIGKVNGMLVLVASMTEDNITPNIVTYNTLINNFRRLCRFDLCLLYWGDMEKKGIQADLRTYTAMIDSLGRSGNVERSLALFHEMKCRHIRPSIYIYRSLIDSAKTMGLPKMAESLHKEMISSMPDLVGPKDFRRKKR